VDAAPRYLTKSRFVLALECETKLFYTGKDGYADRRKEDPFLSALAEGGFQVGEMAKLYFPGGHEIEPLQHDQALALTFGLLERESVTLYEAAVRHRNLFIRADILVKNGSRLDLVEVKSKSFDGAGAADMLTASGTIKSEWVPYLYDVAFQSHVLGLAFPQAEIRSHLLVADRNARASVDGLNQLFLLDKANGRSRVRVREGTTRETLGEPLLIQVPVNEITDMIYAGRDGRERDLPFARWVEDLAQCYEQDRKIQTPLGSKCSGCEFTCTLEEERSGLSSGFKECWREQAGLRDDDFAEPLVIDLWQCTRKDSFLRQGVFLLRDLDPELLRPAIAGAARRGGRGRGAARPSTAGRGTAGAGGGDDPWGGAPGGLSVFERQRLQIEKARNHDPHAYLDAEGLRAEIRRWIYPLHFVDFETTAVAIPFHRGMAPYQGIAFQFSHHRVTADGTTAHVGQYLHRERGSFPSFAFLRALKNELEGDEGTVFRYGDHENTFLNIIYAQLREGDPRELPDREELMQWITTVARPTDRNEGAWEAGRRCTVDLLDLVKRYYYHPDTGGSNSLKRVLPAVLGSSPLLQERYRRPIYGRGLAIESLNFEDWTWVRFDEHDRPVDPYRLLPPVFPETADRELEHLFSESHLADGTAAMVAYARMQFSQMSEEERRAIEEALLKYCELDTLAMVMLWEHWNAELASG